MYYRNPLVENSVNSLLNSCDPRDQLAEDIRQAQSWGGNMDHFLRMRMNQIDCRDQEYQDIQNYFNRIR
jgi:hypothetical protein